MTIIAYKDGVLAADSRALTHDQPGYLAKSAYVVKKMQVFKNKFAVAMTGNILSEASWVELCVSMEMVLGMIEIGGIELPMRSGWMLEKWFAKHMDRVAIIMTKKDTYLILKSAIFLVPVEDNLCFGSGHMVGSSVLQSGGSALEAVDEACLLRRSCGHPILHIDRSDLDEMSKNIDDDGIQHIKESVKNLITYEKGPG